MQGFYGPGWEVACVRAKSLQLCPTLSDPMDSGPPGSSVQGILQARILEWVAKPLFIVGKLSPRLPNTAVCVRL